MKMTFRWYGEGNDSITPDMIRQIPGVTGLVWALHDKAAGDVTCRATQLGPLA